MTYTLQADRNLSTCTHINNAVSWCWNFTFNNKLLRK